MTQLFKSFYNTGSNMEIADVSPSIHRKVRGGAQQVSDWPEEGNQGLGECHQLPGACRSDLRYYEALSRQKDLKLGKLFIPRPEQLQRRPENVCLERLEPHPSCRSLLGNQPSRCIQEPETRGYPTLWRRTAGVGQGKPHLDKAVPSCLPKPSGVSKEDPCMLQASRS